MPQAKIHPILYNVMAQPCTISIIGSSSSMLPASWLYGWLAGLIRIVVIRFVMVTAIRIVVRSIICCLLYTSDAADEG